MVAVLKGLGLRIAEDRETSILPPVAQEGLGERMVRLRHVQNRGGGRRRNGIGGQRAVDEGRPDDGERSARRVYLIGEELHTAGSPVCAVGAIGAVSRSTFAPGDIELPARVQTVRDNGDAATR